MLNISNNRIAGRIDPRDFSALKTAEEKVSGKTLIKILLVMFGVGLIFLFLPWTQNIRSRGNVTTLLPGQRPQAVHSVISGRLEKWYVREGQYVEKGDTIVFISEVKDEYFDPDLLLRTEKQLKAKESSVISYQKKISALEQQIKALEKMAKLKSSQLKNKLRQADLKVASDSMDYKAAIVNLEVAQKQYTRIKKLYEKGLKSLTDLENKKMNLRKAEASKISAENTLLKSKNEVINAEMELSSVAEQFNNSISKAKSEKFSALSALYEAEGELAKLENRYTNYRVRSGMYYITAPQNGYITKAIQSGIGTTLKEGEEIVSIMPSDYQLAVEMYVRPIDLPLVKEGQKVRIQFDGWPAIVFSGWPNTSYGTYGGVVIAIDNFISKNGKYRVLVAPDRKGYQWPDALRVGAGADNMLLLNDVPVWYELWRKVNGFPPDFYQSEKQNVK